MEQSDKKRFNETLPKLAREVDPIEIMPHLSCLSDISRQQIMCRERQDGAYVAMLTLHEHLVRRKQGFQQLVDGLREINKERLADLLIGNAESPEKDTFNKTILERKSPQAIRMPLNGPETLVGDLNMGVWQILLELDYSGQQRWDTLAGHLGYSYGECKRIENDATTEKKSFTHTLLDRTNGVTLARLLTILKHDMERLDIAEKVEQLTGFTLPERDEKGAVEDDHMAKQNFDVDNRNIPRLDPTPDVKQPVNGVPGRSDIIYARNPGKLNCKHNDRYDVAKFQPAVSTNGRAELVQQQGRRQTTNYSPVTLSKPVMKGLLSQSVDNGNGGANEMQVTPNMSTKSSQAHNILIPFSNTEGNNKSAIGASKLNPSVGQNSSSGMETIEDLIEIPIKGEQSRLVKRVRFHKQDSQQPGTYLPTTLGSPSHNQSPVKVITDNLLSFQESSHTCTCTYTDVDHMQGQSDSMVVSVGDPISVHHHESEQFSLEDIGQEYEGTFLSGEEKAELRKAYKRLSMTSDLNTYDENDHIYADESGHQSDIESTENCAGYDIIEATDAETDQTDMSPVKPFNTGAASCDRLECESLISDQVFNNNAVSSSSASSIDTDGEIPLKDERLQEPANTVDIVTAEIQTEEEEGVEFEVRESFPVVKSLLYVGTAAVVSSILYKSFKG